MSKKVLVFYYDMCSQQLAVYPGTPASDIKSALREILKIPDEDELEYLDDTGIPLVVSASMPDGTKIFVKKKKSFTDQFVESTPTKEEEPEGMDWNWLPSSSPSSHPLKNDSKTVYQPRNECIAWCKGSLTMDSGEYYYKLLFDPLQCCVFASICASESTSSAGVNFLDFWRLWPDYPDPHMTFPGPVIEAGFYVNMDKKLLVVYDARLKKEVTRANFSEEWKKVSPIVEFKHVVSVTITSKAFRGKPDFIKL